MKSPKRPIEPAILNAHISYVRECLRRLQYVEAPNLAEWRVLSDVVNMSETFMQHNGGVWKRAEYKGATIELSDDDGVIAEGVKALALVGARHLEAGEGLRICEKGAAALSELIECYEEILEVLPESEVEKCKNITTQRVREILRGKTKPGDVVVKTVLKG